MKKAPTIVVLAILGLTGCGERQVPGQTSPEWDLRSVVDQVHPTGPDDTVHLLAWQMKVNYRFHYLEDIVAVIADGNGSEWNIVHLERDSRESKPDLERWYEFTVRDAPHVGSLRLDHRPTVDELRVFFADTWWLFTPQKDTYDYWCVGAGLYSDAWLDVCNDGPPKILRKDLKAALKTRK